MLNRHIRFTNARARTGDRNTKNIRGKKSNNFNVTCFSNKRLCIIKHIIHSHGTKARARAHTHISRDRLGFIFFSVQLADIFRMCENICKCGTHTNKLILKPHFLLICFFERKQTFLRSVVFCLLFVNVCQSYRHHILYIISNNHKL